jgi:hypothetical protein
MCISSADLLIPEPMLVFMPALASQLGLTGERVPGLRGRRDDSLQRLGERRDADRRWLFAADGNRNSFFSKSMFHITFRGSRGFQRAFRTTSAGRTGYVRKRNSQSVDTAS